MPWLITMFSLFQFCFNHIVVFIPLSEVYFNMLVCYFTKLMKVYSFVVPMFGMPPFLWHFIISFFWFAY